MRSSTRPPRANAAQRAYDFAKWAILNAVYPAGEAVTVGKLAGEIGLSRSPVREALLRLEAEGLVQVEGEPEPVGERPDLLGTLGRGHQVGLEHLDPVEARLRAGVELADQRPAQADGADRRPHNEAYGT